MRARNTKSVKHGENVTPKTLPFIENYTALQNGFQDEITAKKETIDKTLASRVQERKRLITLIDDNLAETSSKSLGTSVKEV